MGRKVQNKQQKCDLKTKESVNLKSNKTKLQPLIDKLLRLTTLPFEASVSKNEELHNELNKTLREVISLEKETDKFNSMASRCGGAILEKFTEWVRAHGATFEGIKIAEFSGFELGLQTEMDIEENSLMIAIPRKLMLTVEAAQNSVLSELIQNDPLLNNMPNVAVSMFLLFEKFKEDSFWKPYIDILPSEYSTVLYFGVDDLKELQASPTFDSALKQIKNIVRQYAYFYKLIWTSDDEVCKLLRKRFTYNQYRWAVSTVMTRQNTVPSEDGSDLISALIPLWDLCNHINGNITTDYNPDLKRSECLAMKNFKAGEQIFIFYGPRSNAELFIHNGFVYEDNQHDGYWLRLGISKSDDLKEKRLQLLDKLGLQDRADFWLKGFDPIDKHLVAFLRVFNMDEAQLTFWLNSENLNCLRDIHCELKPDFVNKCWNFLITRLRLLLRTYKTSLQEDNDILLDKNLPKNKCLAVQMRSSEKRILNNTIDCVSKLIEN